MPTRMMWMISSCFAGAVLAATPLRVYATSADATREAVASEGNERDEQDKRIGALMAKLASMPGLYAEFTERKTIGLLAVPLINHGTLYYAPPGRLLRTIDKPHASRVLLREDEVWMREDGATERVDLGAHPTVRAFVGSFRSLLGGQRAELAKHFLLSLEDRAGGEWVLVLKPRTQAMAKIVAKMTVVGHAAIVERLIIEESGGDVSDTRFEHVDAKRRFSAAEVAKLFQPST